MNRLRRCIVADDGVTVVETLFAIVVLTVALFGLMSTFIASAVSQLDQRSKTAATRSATEFLETSRQYGFEQLKADKAAGCPANSSCAVRTKSVNGQTFTVTPVVSEVDARDPSRGPQPGLPTVMQVQTNVSWTERGVTRTMSFTSSVSPTKPDASKDIKSVTLFPNPAVVSARMSPQDTTTIEGIPTTDIVVSTELKGLDSSTPVSVKYTDDQGLKGPITLTTTDQKVWTATIPRLNIRRAIPSTSDYAELPFLLEVGIGGGVYLRQEQTLLVGRTTEPLAVMPVRTANNRSSTFIQCPYAASSLLNCDQQRSNEPWLRVHKGSASIGMNRDPMIFAAEVYGLKRLPGDKVEVWWQDGTDWVGPLPLAYYITLSNGNTVWYVQLPDKGGWRFPFVNTAPGLPVDFWFIATRAADGQAAQQRMRMNVRGT